MSRLDIVMRSAYGGTKPQVVYLLNIGGSLHRTCSIASSNHRAAIEWALVR